MARRKVVEVPQEPEPAAPLDDVRDRFERLCLGGCGVLIGAQSGRRLQCEGCDGK